MVRAAVGAVFKGWGVGGNALGGDGAGADA